MTRIEALSSMGYIVMLSGFKRYFKCAAYMRRYTEMAIVIALGVPAVKELFNPFHYKDLPGGILENFGRLLSYDQKLYIYPTVDQKTGKLITAKDIKVDPCKPCQTGGFIDVSVQRCNCCTTISINVGRLWLLTSLMKRFWQLEMFPSKS